MFGGLDICSLEAVVAKDDKEYIIEVNDCATTLLGESQEDDRKHIAELVLKTMEVLIVKTKRMYCTLTLIQLQDKLKVTVIPEEIKANENSEKEKPGNSVGSSATNPKKMMSAARQLSKGSLGLGGESSMASTVLNAMGKKKDDQPVASTSTAGPTKPTPPPPVPPGPSKKEPNSEDKPTAPPPSMSRKRHDSQGM